MLNDFFSFVPELALSQKGASVIYSVPGLETSGSQSVVDTKGNSNNVDFGFYGGIGVDVPFDARLGFMSQIRYGLGLSNLVATEPTAKMRGFERLLGISLAFDASEK